MSKSEERYNIFNWRLIILVLLMVVVLVCVFILNNQQTDNSALKIFNTIDIDDGDSKINWQRYSNYDIELSDSLEITKAGVYHLSGALSGGNIIINVSKEDPVKLVLDNVSISSTDGPAIACLEGDDLIIELVGNNYLEDVPSYDTQYDSDITGTLYSKADLTFQGDSSLNITSNYLDGIVSKDDLKFISGNYDIIANDDAIRGKDSVYIIDGSFNIKSNADAIKATNETDNGKGFVFIKNGNFVIDSGAKGIKAINSLLINNGSFSITSYDDSLHSNNYIGILGGVFEIDSLDDGMHADNELIIDNGSIVVSRAYEGIEAKVVTINGGDISLTTHDDGINAGGGADDSSMNRPGSGMFNVEADCSLSINGGYVYVNSSGDGIDSNGYLYFNGGDVVIDGPANNGNGALDSGTGIVMNGGTVFAVGASGMAVSLGSSSNVHNISVYFDSVLNSGTTIEIRDSKGETVLSHTSAKSFNHLSAGTEQFELGATYTIYINNYEYIDFTISDITTVIGEINGGTGPDVPQDVNMPIRKQH